MKHLLFLALFFCFWLPVFLIQKPFFLLFNREIKHASWLDFLEVMYHGLSLDASVAGYLTALPFLALLSTVWIRFSIKRMLCYYVRFMAVLIALIFTVDIALYAYWGFRLDATIFFYLASPKNALASVSWEEFILQGVLFIAYAGGIDWSFRRWILPYLPTKFSRKPMLESLCFLLAGGLIFLAIRGGVGTSTQNVGKAYYSKVQFFNHAAINPCFSLLASLSKQQDFAAQFNFHSEQKRAELFEELQDKTIKRQENLLTTTRPNVLFVLLESFTANAIEALGGTENVTPQLNALCKEGILFTQMYANSFRTDRGIVSILNGYLAQPTTSIMKYPAKSQTLPSISKSLQQAGYTNDMLYGGDINFTNMKSYFYASGYSHITADTDFPLTSRLNKWGANDDYTFSHLFKELNSRTESTANPWMTSFLTLSSHEPFEVPYNKLEDPYLNSVAFTDSCLGDFITKLKQTPIWKDLLVVLVADHGFRYPADVSEYEPRRYHIPMLWIGGAVRKPRTINTYGSQTDLAKTLLNQMELPSEEFTFSKDLTSKGHPNYAFYSYNNGFGFIDSTGVTVFNNENSSVVFGEKDSSRLQKGQALLQTLYDDLERRDKKKPI